MIPFCASACACLAQVRVRYGSQRLYILLRREGWPDNHKRVHRLYCLEGLNLRSKRPRRNRAAAHRLERLPLRQLHQSWSMDFVADNLFDGRKIRALTIVDNFSRQCLAIHVGQSLKGEDVVAVMQRLHQQLGLVPKRICTLPFKEGQCKPKPDSSSEAPSGTRCVSSS